MRHAYYYTNAYVTRLTLCPLHKSHYQNYHDCPFSARAYKYPPQSDWNYTCTSETAASSSVCNHFQDKHYLHCSKRWRRKSGLYGGCSITTISQESLCWMCVVTLSSSRIINKGLDLFWWTAILSLFPVFDLIVWSCGMKTTSSTPSAFYNNTVAINFFADWIWEFHYDVCFQFWNQPWSQKLHYSPRPYQCAPFQKLYLVFFFGIQS